MFDVNLAIRECKQTNLLKNLLILIFNNFIEDDRNRTLSLVVFHIGMNLEWASRHFIEIESYRRMQMLIGRDVMAKATEQENWVRLW